MPNADPKITASDIEELFASVGIDPLANLETIRLALRGKIAELDDQIKTLHDELRPKRGAPKRVLSEDASRALRLIGLAQVLHEHGFKPQFLMSLIRFSYQAEAILEDNGHNNTGLFPLRGERTIEQSVRRGIKALGVDMGLYQTNPEEFFVRCKVTLA